MNRRYLICIVLGILKWSFVSQCDVVPVDIR